MLGSNKWPLDQQSRAMKTELMDKCTIDTQVHHILFVAYVGSNNQWKTDNNPNELSWLYHIISNDAVCGLTPQLRWIEDALNSIIDTFGNRK